ncbi:MAG: cupin domain-containing protein [Victivallaceae bacterium]|nr:cupin domain-containing protein [Victivallaceae bacterium]
MRNMLFIICLAVIGFLFGGCVSSGPAPQDVKLVNPDGRAVIIKDIYELPLIENRKLKETEIVKVFFPQTDNVMMYCSMTLLKIPPGVSPPKYKQSSAQIIYAISGGGKLLVNNTNMIILKKGIMVYVPPDIPMLITNNVNKILEIIVVTSPPFEPSQMEVLEEAPKKAKVAKDPEDEFNNEIGGQDVSEKYRTDTRTRSLSIEEYREKINKTMTPLNEKDPISALLNEAEKDKKTPLKDTWPLRMPDSSKEPLDKLEKEQEEKLIPATPQKADDTSMKDVQELTPSEHKEPLPDELKTSTPETPKVKEDLLDKLLNEQEKQDKKSEGTAKVKKTSLKHIQELSPEEHKGSVYKKTRAADVNSSEKVLKDQEKIQEELLPKKTLKANKTSLKHIQELTPEEHKDSVAKDKSKVDESGNNTVEDPLEKLLREEKKQRTDQTLKAKKTSLEHIQELSPEESAVKTKSDKEP